MSTRVELIHTEENDPKWNMPYTPAIKVHAGKTVYLAGLPASTNVMLGPQVDTFHAGTTRVIRGRIRAHDRCTVASLRHKHPGIFVPCSRFPLGGESVTISPQPWKDLFHRRLGP